MRIPPSPPALILPLEEESEVMAVAPVKGTHRVEARTAVPLVKQHFTPVEEGGAGDPRHGGERRTACRRVQEEQVALDTRAGQERRRKKRRRDDPPPEGVDEKV